VLSVATHSMLLVVCPNLAIDRILQVNHFESEKVQRTGTALTQPGGKGSNVARVFRQLGGEVVLTGFVGRRNRAQIIEPLRRMGVRVDAVAGFEGDSRTCTIICDPASSAHPTVINEESPEIERGAAATLLSVVEKWIRRVDAVLTTGSLSHGLSDHFYAEVLDRARSRGRFTALDATGSALRFGLLTRPLFMKPNAEEFHRLISESSFSFIAEHTALTFGTAGAALIHGDECLYQTPPRIFDINPIGAGDAFTAAYLYALLRGTKTRDCLRFAVAAAACDAGTLRPGFIDQRTIKRLLRKQL
jgi:1-phosphofructokinase family hexose kinase